MNLTREDLGRFFLLQSDSVFRLGQDTLALGTFAAVRPGWQVCDLGCGTGALLLLLRQREETLALTGIELQAEAAELAARNLRENDLPGTIIQGDLRDPELLPADAFDLVISNPPYFRLGSGGSGGPARMEETCTLKELCACASRILRSGGRLALVWRPERLTDLLCTLREYGLEPKRMQLLAHGPEHPPYALLLESRKGGRPGLEVLPVKYRNN